MKFSPLPLLLGFLTTDPLLAQTTITVDTLVDEETTPASDGTGVSLREAIRDIQPEGMIIFALSLSGGTIALNATLEVEKSLTIDASGLPEKITVDGGVEFSSPVFDSTVNPRPRKYKVLLYFSRKCPH